MLSLRPREAAIAIGISPRHLATLTKANVIPHVRLGRAVVYPVAVLEQWLAEQAKKGGGQP
jgi:hypothetical protein